MIQRNMSSSVAVTLGATVVLSLFVLGGGMSIANLEPPIGTCCIPAVNMGLPDQWCEIDPVEGDCVPGNGVSCNGIVDEILREGECVTCPWHKKCVTENLGVPVRIQLAWERYTAHCPDSGDCDCVIASFEPPVTFLTWVNSCEYE